jgi:hypothetical protein
MRSAWTSCWRLAERLSGSQVERPGRMITPEEVIFLHQPVIVFSLCQQRLSALGEPTGLPRVPAEFASRKLPEISGLEIQIEPSTEAAR